MSVTGRIAQVAIPVQDLARATAFYRDVVGLPFMFEAPNVAFFDCHGTRLMLGRDEEASERRASILYYAVDDVRSEHGGIVARGAAALQDPHVIARLGPNELWMAFYADSEGNTFALASEHPATGAGTAVGDGQAAPAPRGE